MTTKIKQTGFRIPERVLDRAKSKAKEEGFPSLNAWIIQVMRKETSEKTI